MAATEDGVGSLESAALKRKERLAALKRKHAGDSNETADGGAAPLPKPVFRSYKPIDEQMHDDILPPEKPVNIEEHVVDQIENAKKKIVAEELDLTNLAPRKPDWDLKRDLAKKLEKLERQTERAIAELIRERLKKKQRGLG